MSVRQLISDWRIYIVASFQKFNRKKNGSKLRQNVKTKSKKKKFFFCDQMIKCDIDLMKLMILIKMNGPVRYRHEIRGCWCDVRVKKKNLALSI